VLNNVGQFTNSGTVATSGTTEIGTAQFNNLERGVSLPPERRALVAVLAMRAL
jgi:hypothetical protein